MDAADNKGATMSENAGFTLTFWLEASSPQAKMCPERLPEPANAGPQLAQGIFGRGVAEHTASRMA